MPIRKNPSSIDLPGMGLLKIRVLEGIKLAKCEKFSSSDPYVVVTMGEQKFKTCLMNDDCNPAWNEEFTLSVEDPDNPIHLAVYDKDTFSGDDKMGDAEIDIKPLLRDGHGRKDMTLKLRNAKSGDLHIQIEWLGQSSGICN